MLFLLALGAMGYAGNAEAQQILYWSGTAGTAAPTWNTPLAWSTGSVAWAPPAAFPGANDTAVVGIASLSGPQLVQISGTQSVFGLVFSSTSPTALSGTNGTSALTIGAGGITVTPSADFYVFGLDGPSTSVTVALSGSTGQRWNNQSSNVPNLHGPFARGRGATLTMLGNAPFALRSATNTFGMLGPWATYEGGPAVGYLMVGAGGTMTAFTGATPAATAAAVTDTTGTMNYDVAGPGALGPNASFNTLRYTGGAGTISGSFTANGLMNAGDPGGGTLAFSGRITAGATGELVVAAGRVIDLQGTIADGGGPSTLVKTGTGTLILSANNSYTGGTVVNDGTVMMARPLALGSGTSSLAVTSGTLSIGGYSVPVSSLSGGPGGMITGSGTLTVTGSADSTYAGGFASGGMPSSPTLVKSGSGALTLAGSNSLANMAINGGRIVAGHANALGGGTTAIAVNAGTLDIGTVSPVIGALTGSSGAIITTASTVGVRTLITSFSSGSAVYAGSIQDNGVGTIGLTTYGAASLTLSGSNSFSGPTRLVAGGVTIANPDALAGTTLDLQAGDTGGLTYNVYSGTMNIGGLTGSRTITFPSYATIAIGGNGQSTIYSGTLSGSGAFVKQGAGTLTLTGSAPVLNPYSGTVRIAGGTLALGNPSALSSATVEMNPADAGTLAFSGTAPQTYGLAALTGSRGVNLGGNTLAIGAWTSSTSTYQGTLSGSGGLHKFGTSTLALAGSNAYTGTTRIEAGALRIDNRDALAGTTLDLRAGDTGGLWINTSSGTLNIGGLTGSRSFDVPNSYTTAVGGNGQSTTYSGTLAGSGTFVKQGAGTLTLTGSAPVLNPYSGTVRIAGGTLALGNPSALSSATVEMNPADAGTLAFSGTAPQTYGLAALTGSRGVNLGGNTLAIGTWTSSTSTYQGTLSGSGGLHKFGTSTLALGGSNAYTGTTRIEAGTLRIDNRDALAGSTLDLQAGDTGGLWINAASGTLNIGGLTGSRSFDVPNSYTTAVGGNGQSTTYSGTLAGSGTFVKQGAGTLTLTGSAPVLNPYSGTVRIAGGTLALGNPAALAGATVEMNPADVGALGFSGTGPQTYAVAALTGSRGVNLGGNTLAIGSWTSSTGTYQGTFSGSGGLIKVGSGTLALTGSNALAGIAINGGRLVAGHANALGGGTTAIAVNAGTLDIGTVSPVIGALTGSSGGIITTASTAGVRTLNTFIASESSVYAGSIRDNGAGTIGLLKAGAGSLTLAGSNSYTGPTRIQDGTLEISNRDALAGTTLDLQAGDTGTLAVNVLPSGTVTIGGLAGSRSFDVSSTRTTAVGGNGQSTTYAGTLSGSGAFVKQGAGTLTLTGSAPVLNPYAGTVRIAGGTLALGNPAALAAATVEMNAADAGTLAFSGTAPQTYALAALTGSRNFNLGGNTLAIGSESPTYTGYEGTLSGSGGLIKVGSSTLALTNSNAYTGTTRIQGGTLEIYNRDALAGTTLDLQAGDTGTLTYNLLPSGTVNIGGLSGSRSFDVSSTRTTAVGGNGQSTTYSGTLSGSGAFVKQGAGTLTLTGSAPVLNPYTGTVRIAGGTLALGNPAALAAATVEMNAADAGTLAFSGTAPQTYSLAALTGSRNVNLGGNTLAIGSESPTYTGYEGTLSGSGGLIKVGSSTLALTNSNAYTGSTRIQGGTLEIYNRDALAGSTLDLQTGDTGTLAVNVLPSGTVNIGGLAGSRPVSIPSFVTVAVGGNGQSTTYSGSFTNSGAFVKQGAGTLTLTGTGALSGGTVTVNEGRLVGSASNLGGTIFNNATLEFAQATSGTFGGLVFSSTNTGVQTVKSGAGTLALTGTIFGNVTVSGGRLVTQAANIGGQLVADGTVEFAQATSGTFTGTLAGSGGLVKTGGGTLALQGGTFNGTTTVSGGRLVASAATLRGPIVANATLEFAQAINGEHVAVISGSGTVVKSGAGTLLLSGANLFTGTTSVVEGILATAAADRLADASTVSLAPDGSLRLGGNETIATLLGSGSVNLQTFQLTIAGGGTFAGGLFGSGGLTKAGSGSLALSGSSGFLGATRLNAGTLVLSSPSALSSFTTLSIASGATLVLDTDVRVFAYTNAGTITGAGQLLTSATTATSGTLSALSDASGPDGYSVGLLKTSTDTLVVSGSTTFTGGVVVEQGTVQLAEGGSFAPTNVVEVQSGATLDLNGQSQTVAALSGGGGVALGGGTLTVASTTDTVFDGAITGGSLVKAGSSVLDLTGSSTVSTATVTEGVLSVNGTLTGDVAVAPEGVLGGAGTIVGDVAVSGTHAPGNSPDISTITGDLSYVMGSTVIWELAANTDAQGPLAARTHDQVVVGQSLAFTGSTSLVLSFFDQDPNSSWISTVDWTDPFWDEDRAWTLWDVAGTTTGFGNLSIAPGSWLDANGTPIDSIRPDAVFLVRLSGSDVQLVYSVPEPGTLALAAGGLACAAWGTWRRTRRRGNRGWVGVEPRSISSFLAIALVVACAGTVRAQDVSVTGGAVQSNESPASYSFLSVSGTSPGGSPSTYSANAALTLTDSFFVHSAGVLNANANINVANNASLGYGGRLNLNAGVLTANYLNVSGTIVRGGGTYNARGLGITQATVEYATGDSVAEQIFVNSGGRLVLSRNLSLTGAFQVDKGEVLRSTATIAASHINLFGATLDLRAGDTVNTTNPNVMSTVKNTGTTSATLNVTGSMTFGKLSVQEGSTLNANAPMQARLVSLRTNATANINANVAVPNDGVWIESGAKINLSSGTLSSYQLRATGTGAITRTGGSYAVTNLFLEGGAATTYSAGDSIAPPYGSVSLYQGGVLTLNRDLATSQLWLSGSNSVLVRNGHSIAVSSLSMSDGAVFTTLASDSAGDARISGTGTVLTANSPLTVSYLDVWNGATLRLESFTGSWSGAGGFALAVQGDVRERLDGYVSSGRIQPSNNPGPIMVTYDDAVIRTYVVSATGSQVVSGSTTIFGTVTGSTSVSSGGAATFAGQVTGTVTVAPGGQATFAGGLAGAATITGSATVQGVVSGAVSASNGGNVVITGSVAPTAQVSVGAGSTVSIGNGAAVAQPTLANAGKFAVANTGGTVVVPTAITGTGSFEKTGAGSVQLTGSSNFTGGSTIASGEVVVQNAKALGSGGVTVSSGGKLLVDGVALNLGGAAVSLVTGAELRTTSGARVTVSGSSDLSGVRSTSPAATTAAILAGTAVSGTLATTWTTSANSAVKSEVLELKTPTSAANPFVLSLQYASGLDPAGFFLGWNDPVSGDWVNAVVGNELLSGMTAATGGQLGYLGSFSAFQGFYGTNLSSYLGAYGRDDSSRTVWAVINHNSEFAITAVSPVPEPTTVALAALGLAGVALRPRRRRP